MLYLNFDLGPMEMHWMLASFIRKEFSPRDYWSQAWMINKLSSSSSSMHLGNKYLCKPHLAKISFRQRTHISNITTRTFKTQKMKTCDSSNIIYYITGGNISRIQRKQICLVMHVKCIHELCTITLLSHSYLHHISGILLLFNDFW